jgi:hypothetical protein
MSDGAYDGEPVSQAVLDQQPDAQVIIPPHKTAVVSNAGDTQRDQHFKPLRNKGESPGSKKRAITCAIMLSLPCNAISAFLATP